MSCGVEIADAGRQARRRHAGHRHVACGRRRRPEPSRPIRLAAVEPAVRHPYAVVVDPRGRVFVADGAARRIVLVSPRTGRRSVHATGFDEPTGLAATRNALYVADFHAGLVRRVDAAGRVTTLARLPQVTAVAVSPSGAVYAVTMNGVLARISASGRIARVPVPGGLDRPHGVVFDRAGDILVAEDSRRVRRIDPATGRANARGRRRRHEQDRRRPRRDPVPRRRQPDRRQPSPARAGRGSRRSCSRASTSATSPSSRTAT